MEGRTAADGSERRGAPEPSRGEFPIIRPDRLGPTRLDARASRRYFRRSLGGAVRIGTFMRVPFGLPLVLAGSLLGGCARGTGNGNAEPAVIATPIPVPHATPSNLIDQVLALHFAADSIKPEPAGPEELCRRLSADLLGRYVSAAQARSDCSGRTAEEVAVEYQTRDAYLLNEERFWRDRFGTSDVLAGWRELKDLYALVDAMQRDELPYDEFAIQAMSHPAVMSQSAFPEERAARVFTAFMGRVPTRTEKRELAALYRPWGKRHGTDPDIPLLVRTYSTVDPSLCAPASACATDLYGTHTQIDFSSFATLPPGPARWYKLDETQKDALRAPGRLLVAQPFFWEAAADEILNRLLGWSDGGSSPNEPGILLPEVREVLAAYLRQTKSIPRGERLVIGSWLYRMTSRVPDDGLGDDPSASVAPLWAHGPRNPILAEVWIHSAAALTTDLGECDPRYPDDFDDADIAGPDSASAAARLKLWTLQESRTPWDPVASAPDHRFRDAARRIGGCPGLQAPMLTVIPRLPQTGLTHALAQESLLEELCSHPAAGLTEPDLTVATALGQQMPRVWGRSPTPAEIADFEDAFASCTGDDCGPDGIARQVCGALLGGAEMEFH